MRELATPKFWHDDAGRRVLESKDDIKKHLQDQASPDLADALALTFAMPVMPGVGRQMGAGPQVNRQVIDFDPIDHALGGAKRQGEPMIEAPWARRIDRPLGW